MARIVHYFGILCLKACAVVAPEVSFSPET
jgi:hypothetical protein